MIRPLITRRVVLEPLPENAADLPSYTSWYSKGLRRGYVMQGTGAKEYGDPQQVLDGLRRWPKDEGMYVWTLNLQEGEKEPYRIGDIFLRFEGYDPILEKYVDPDSKIAETGIQILEPDYLKFGITVQKALLMF